MKALYGEVWACNKLELQQIPESTVSIFSVVDDMISFEGPRVALDRPSAGRQRTTAPSQPFGD
jgi:hypothetical protein